MTRNDIIRMAKESDATISLFNGQFTMYVDELERFAALVAAHEREACAKVCDEKAKRNYNWASENADIYHAQAHWAGRIAAAIRARGQE